MKLKRIGLIFIMSSLAVFSQAQVNAVEFGKNRVQYKKLVWKLVRNKELGLDRPTNVNMVAAH